VNTPQRQSRGWSMPAPPLPVDQWCNLKARDRVSVTRESGYPATGQIDAMSEDASVFWVTLDHGMGRILVHSSDKVVVRRASKKPSKTAYSQNGNS
jgi:hypothetical protein